MNASTMSYQDMLLSAHVAGALAAVLVFVGHRFGLTSSLHLFKHIIGLLGPPRHDQKYS